MGLCHEGNGATVSTSSFRLRQPNLAPIIVHVSDQQSTQPWWAPPLRLSVLSTMIPLSSVFSFAARNNRSTSSTAGSWLACDEAERCSSINASAMITNCILL